MAAWISPRNTSPFAQYLFFFIGRLDFKLWVVARQSSQMLQPVPTFSGLRDLRGGKKTQKNPKTLNVVTHPFQATIVKFDMWEVNVHGQNLCFAPGCTVSFWEVVVSLGIMSLEIKQSLGIHSKWPWGWSFLFPTQSCLFPGIALLGITATHKPLLLELFLCGCHSLISEFNSIKIIVHPYVER